MEPNYVVFSLIMTVAMLVFFIGVYTRVIRTLIDIYRVWRNNLDFTKFNVFSLWTMLRKEVVLQLQLKGQSNLRWLRHVLIYWGFVILLLLDGVYVLSVKVLQTLLGMDMSKFNVFVQFGFEFAGTVLIIGLILALIRAALVKGTRQNIYSYTKETVLLFLILISGYIVEAFRIAGGDFQFEPYQFLGGAMAIVIKPLDLPWDTLHLILWYAHAILAAMFFAYLPFSKLVHIIAVPIGLLMRSQEGILEARLQSVVKGLLNERNGEAEAPSKP